MAQHSHNENTVQHTTTPPPPEQRPRRIRCQCCGRLVTHRHFFKTAPRCVIAQRVWTPATRWKLLALTEKGWDNQRIAAALGVSENAVVLARKIYKLPSLSKVFWSGNELARRLGLRDHKLINYLITNRILHAQRGPARGPNRQWLIRRDDVLDFLARPECQCYIDIDRITDAKLKAYAQRHAQSHGRFITAEEAAQRLFVVTETVRRWAREGKIRAISARDRWFISEQDCQRFIHPGQRRQDEALALLATLYGRGLTKTAIAVLIGLGRGYTCVLKRYEQRKVWPSKENLLRLRLLVEETQHLPPQPRAIYGARSLPPDWQRIRDRIVARYHAELATTCAQSLHPARCNDECADTPDHHHPEDGAAVRAVP